MNRRLGEILAKAKVVTPEQFNAALREQRETGEFVGQILVARGYATETQIAKALAWQLNSPFISLAKTRVEEAAVDLVPLDIAKKYVCLPVKLADPILVVVMHNPLDLMAVEELSFATNMKIKPVLATRSDIVDGIARHYKEKAKREKAVRELETSVMADARELDRAESGSRSFSIISNKGGVGKTHAATNLAFCLSEMGNKVLLIDADFSNADVSNKLALFPEATLFDLLMKKRGIQDIITETPFGFHLIAGKTGRFRLANLTDEQKLTFIDSFNKVGLDYDMLVLDLGAGLSPQVVDFALATDETIILTTPQDILAGYACAKVSFIRFVELEMGLAKKIKGYVMDKTFRPRVILNQISWVEQGKTFFERISGTAGSNLNKDAKGFEIACQYLGGVLHDHEYHRQAESKKAPFSKLFATRPAAQCYEHLAKGLLHEPTEVPAFKLRNRFVRFAEVIRQKI